MARPQFVEQEQRLLWPVEAIPPMVEPVAQVGSQVNPAALAGKIVSYEKQTIVAQATAEFLSKVWSQQHGKEISPDAVFTVLKSGDLETGKQELAKAFGIDKSEVSSLSVNTNLYMFALGTLDEGALRTSATNSGFNEEETREYMAVALMTKLLVAQVESERADLEKQLRADPQRAEELFGQRKEDLKTRTARLQAGVTVAFTVVRSEYAVAGLVLQAYGRQMGIELTAERKQVAGNAIVQFGLGKIGEEDVKEKARLVGLKEDEVLGLAQLAGLNIRALEKTRLTAEEELLTAKKEEVDAIVARAVQEVQKQVGQFAESVQRLFAAQRPAEKFAMLSSLGVGDLASEAALMALILDDIERKRREREEMEKQARGEA